MSKLRHLPESAAETVTVIMNPLEAGYLARCERCGESVTAHRYTWAVAWADNHTCDGELVALLADLDRRAA